MITRHRKKLAIQWRRAIRAVRKRPGAALPAVLAMGVVIAMTLGTMFSTLIPVYHKVGEMRNGTTLRGVAEAGLDYVIANVNASANYTIPTSPVTVPVSVTHEPNATVSVTLNNS